jgi:hypothetical protein
MSFITLFKADRVKLVTTRAVLIQYDGLREIWIPRSVIENGDTIAKDDEDVVVQEWFAEREGLE